MRSVPLNMFEPSNYLFDNRSKMVLLLGIMFRICLCYAVLSVPCNLVITCWKKAGFLVLFCVMFSCVFVTFLYGVMGQVWYLIVSIPDICLLDVISVMESGMEQGGASGLFSSTRLFTLDILRNLNII